MSDASGFGKLAPGFDFLQSLAKNAGNALPGLGQWIAPTLDPAELDKRIGELRTVQYWLEQNARMLATTIQALEVQRMTLTTLKSMNVPMAELTESLKIQPARARAPSSSTQNDSAKKSAGNQSAGKSAPPVDPMQWWGALTQQFAQLATSAMKDADVAKVLAGGMVKQSIDAAGQAMQQAAGATARAVAGSGEPSTDAVARAAGAKRARQTAKRTRAKPANAAKS